MKQTQRQTVKVIVNNRRPVARRRRTRRDMKQVEMPINPYAMIPQQFAPPVRKNLEVGYNLFSKLAEQKKEELKKTSDQLDERSASLDQRATQLNNRESALNDAVMIADKSLDVRQKNLDTIAEDLDLRFRTPVQTSITTPIYMGESTPAEKTFSPPGLETPPPKPSFKDILTGGAKPDQPPRPSMTPQAEYAPPEQPRLSIMTPPQSATKQLKGELTGIQDTIAVYINGENQKEVILRLLQKYGEQGSRTASLSQLKQLAIRVVKQKGTSASDLESELNLIKETMRGARGGGGGSGKKAR